MNIVIPSSKPIKSQIIPGISAAYYSQNFFQNSLVMLSTELASRIRILGMRVCGMAVIWLWMWESTTIVIPALEYFKMRKGQARFTCTVLCMNC